MNTLLLTVLLLTTDPKVGDQLTRETRIKAGQQWKHEDWIYKVREVRKGEIRFHVITDSRTWRNRGDRLDNFKKELYGATLIKEKTPGTLYQVSLASLFDQ